MKKLLTILILVLALVAPKVFASDEAEVMQAFNTYVNAANNYSPSILGMYSPNARIIRQVVRPDGTTANATTNMKVYAQQMKISQTVAKVNRYTNKYRNPHVIKVSKGYKLVALRQPMKDSYWLKMYQIWQKQPNGKWLIVEEMMQTKEQIFLKYADK